MADLTSTLSISGTVNGRRISIDHVYTMENAYDAGVHYREGVQGTLMTGDAPNGSAVTFVQDTPNYMLVANHSQYGVGECLMSLSGSQVSFMLPPGGLACLTGRLGLALATTSATSTSVEDVSSIVMNDVQPYPPGRLSLMVGFNGIS